MRNLNKRIFFIVICLFILREAYPTSIFPKEWGVSAVTLGKPQTDITIQHLLESEIDILLFNDFYAIGGSNDSPSQTKSKIAYTNDTLYVLFQCFESEMDFSLPEKDNSIQWYNLLNTPVEQDAYYPDKIDFFIQPSVSRNSYYQFCATIDGQQFGAMCDYQLSTNRVTKKFNNIIDFRSSVIKNQNEWIVFLRIPWKTLGGKPTGYFGINPVRTKWRNSFVSSPVAMDFTDRPATDLFIEADFGNTPKTHITSGALCVLPSGKYRWQRFLYKNYPNRKIKEEIWELQQSLHVPTTLNNLGHRLLLLNYWIDLMEIEGFNFGSTRGSLPEIDMYPSDLRLRINNKLQSDNFTEACEELDNYLKEFDKISRKWYADNSPGNISSEKWSNIQNLLHIKENDTILTLTCKTAKKNIDIHLSFPSIGGIRLNASDKGFFNTDSSYPANHSNNKNRYIYENKNNRITITKDPFEIVLEDLNNESTIHIQGKDIAFLFDGHGQIKASDFKINVDESEILYGFGEKFDRFNQNNNVLTIWGVDDWNGLTVGLQNQSYKAIPLFHSSHNYMIFVNSSYRLRVDTGKSKENELRLSLHGNIFDYYFWLSTPKYALKSYARLTGKPILPPKWAFEPWMGRKGTAWNAPFNDPVREQKRVITEFQKLQIPHSAIYAEGSGADSPALYTFTNPRKLKVLSWSYPEIKKETQQKLLSTIHNDSLPLLKIENPKNLASRNISYVDFTHPNARELLRRWWKTRLDLGLAGSMVDFGDRVPEDVIFYDGRTGAQMHNFYAYDYHRTYYEVFKERRGDDFILFGRSAAPGTQKWVAQFAGDLRSNYKGLQGALNGMLNLSASGFSTMGSDLGGFRGISEPNVYIRWTQLSAFSPIMRAHGRTPREPWVYGENATKNYKFYAWVRLNLLDYIHNSAIEANTTGLPIIKSMPIVYPEEYKINNSTYDQYMFGENIMVCPVVTDNSQKTIFFPRGSWINLWNGELVFGPQTITRKVPLLEIPVYLKEDAIIPVKLNEDLQLGKELINNEVNALIITSNQNNKNLSFILNSNVVEIRVLVNNVNNWIDITVNNYPDLLYLLFYQDVIKSIEVNGVEIPEMEINNKEYIPVGVGWVQDSSSNRTNIRLPYAKTQNIRIFLEK